MCWIHANSITSFLLNDHLRQPCQFNNYGRDSINNHLRRAQWGLNTKPWRELALNALRSLIRINMRLHFEYFFPYELVHYRHSSHLSRGINLERSIPYIRGEKMSKGVGQAANSIVMRERNIFSVKESSGKCYGCLL